MLKYVRHIIWGFVFSAAAVVLLGVIAEETGLVRSECTDWGVVETIDKVAYRTVFFTLKDGRAGHLDQPYNLVPGEKICLHSKRIYGF